MVVTEDGTRTVAEILVRKVPDDRQCIDLRVCILGSADVGKSTLLGKFFRIRDSLNTCCFDRCYHNYMTSNVKYLSAC